MKKLIYILLFLFPVVAIAQQPWYKYSPLDSAWQNVGNAGFSAGEAIFTCIAFSPSGELYAGYADEGNSGKASVMTFNGTNWVYVGSPGFSLDYPDDFNLAISPSDSQPYVSYQDWGASDKATVMKFDGVNWVNVGNAGFSPAKADWLSLAFSSSGQPYVAFSDYSDDKGTVMRFDGTNWVYVGIEGFTAGFPSYNCLAFNPSDGQPYLAFTADEANSGKATVMKFDGTNWINVGNAGFSAGKTWFMSLAFNQSGQPYVAYLDDANSDKATVMKFDGTNWINVGNAGFSLGEIWSTSLAFNPSDGQPYVAYSDSVNSWKATVMKFDGTNWVNVGNAGFSDSKVYSTSLAFSPSDGAPYVGYEDIGNSAKATVMKYDSVYVGINELKQLQLSLFPNPATDKITVERSGTVKETNLAIVDIEGQEFITSQITEPKTQVDISNLTSGVYFVRVTNDRTVVVRKFVKE